MRNHNHDRVALRALPFDDMAGLEVTEPRNRMEQQAAWDEYQAALLRFERENNVFGGLVCKPIQSQ